MSFKYSQKPKTSSQLVFYNNELIGIKAFDGIPVQIYFNSYIASVPSMKTNSDKQIEEHIERHIEKNLKRKTQMNELTYKPNETSLGEAVYLSGKKIGSYIYDPINDNNIYTEVDNNIYAGVGVYKKTFNSVSDLKEWLNKRYQSKDQDEKFMENEKTGIIVEQLINTTWVVLMIEFEKDHTNKTLDEIMELRRSLVCDPDNTMKISNINSCVQINQDLGPLRVRYLFEDELYGYNNNSSEACYGENEV